MNKKEKGNYEKGKVMKKVHSFLNVGMYKSVRKEMTVESAKTEDEVLAIFSLRHGEDNQVRHRLMISISELIKKSNPSK